MAKRLAGLLCTSLCIGGVRSAGAQVPTPTPASSPTPTTALAGGKTCTVGPPQTIATRDSKRLYALSFFSDSQGAMLAWSEATDEIRIVPLSLTGEPQGEVRSQKLAGARRLSQIRRWDDQHYLVFTHSLCEPAIRDHKCLVAQRVDKTGAPVGDPARHDTNEWMDKDGIQQVGQKLYVLYHTMYKPPRLVTLDPDAQGALRIQEPRGFAACAAGFSGLPGSMYGLRIVANRAGWWVLRPTVVLDPGSAGSTTSRLEGALCTDGKVTPVRGLPADMSIEDFQQTGDTLWALYGPDPSTDDSATDPKRRKRVVVQMDLQGKLKGTPKSLPPGQPLPPPFAAADTLSGSLGRLEESKGRLRLLRSGTRGQTYPETSLGALSPGSNDGPFADAGWAGDRFLVASASYEKKAWQIVVRSVRCAP